MFRFMNNLRTFILLAALMALFLAIGSHWGQQGIVMAFILGGFTNIFAYFFSDKLALATMHAQPVDENQAPQLYQIVRELTEKANLPMPRIYICPQQAPNAFATGRNPRHAAVAVTQGLLNILDYNELKGVLGHELARVKHRDILISSVAATIAGAISALGYLFYFLPMQSSDDRRSGNALVALAMIILGPIAAMIIQMAISRKREYNADNYGAELSGSPMYLATALEKLHYTNRRIPMQVPLDSQKNMFIVQPFNDRDAVD